MILPRVPTPESLLEAKDAHRQLAAALERLPAREERVIRLRYGIGCECMAYGAIAEKLNVSPARALQIHFRALRRMREAQYNALLTRIVRPLPRPWELGAISPWITP